MRTAPFVDGQLECRGVQVTVPSCIATNFNSSVDTSPFSDSNYRQHIPHILHLSPSNFQIIFNTWIFTNAQANMADKVPGGKSGV